MICCLERKLEVFSISASGVLNLTKQRSTDPRAQVFLESRYEGVGLGKAGGGRGVEERRERAEEGYLRVS